MSIGRNFQSPTLVTRIPEHLDDPATQAEAVRRYGWQASSTSVFVDDPQKVQELSPDGRVGFEGQIPEFS